MELDALRIEIEKICKDTVISDPAKVHDAQARLEVLFSNHRSEVFEISNRRDDWTKFEKEIAEGLPKEYRMMQRQGIAFITCSCGSREDSCPEDGNGNFSTFVFTHEGEVFRIVEKKA